MEFIQMFCVYLYISNTPMRFESDQFYHVYNQGNNKHLLFFEEDNYPYFLKLVEHFIVPHCNIIAWCLMPNHYHFLIGTNEESVKQKQVGSLNLQELSNGFRLLQSTYSAAINKRVGRSGALFRQKYKSKFIDTKDNGTNLKRCFHYIHQNPLVAGLSSRIEDWRHSSFNAYHQRQNDGLTNTTKGIAYLEIDLAYFYQESVAKLVDDSEL
jgi:putative transposase